MFSSGITCYFFVLQFWSQPFHKDLSFFLFSGEWYLEIKHTHTYIHIHMYSYLTSLPLSLSLSSVYLKTQNFILLSPISIQNYRVDFSIHFYYMYSDKSGSNHHQIIYLLAQSPMYITNRFATIAQSSSSGILLTSTLTQLPKPRLRKGGRGRKRRKNVGKIGIPIYLIIKVCIYVTEIVFEILHNSHRMEYKYFV